MKAAQIYTAFVGKCVDLKADAKKICKSYKNNATAKKYNEAYNKN